MQGFDSIAVGNEKSANYHNTTFLGMSVNHQWDKSIEFEMLTAQFLRHFVSEEILFFSPLNHMWEIEIVREFCSYPPNRYLPFFISCNMIDDSDPSNYKWCCQCPKCAFLFVMLAAFLPVTVVSKTVFQGQDLLDVAERQKKEEEEKENEEERRRKQPPQKPQRSQTNEEKRIRKIRLWREEEATLSNHFEALLKITESMEKPFDCVGTEDEVRMACWLIAKRCRSTEEPLPAFINRHLASISKWIADPLFPVFDVGDVCLLARSSPLDGEVDKESDG